MTMRRMQLLTPLTMRSTRTLKASSSPPLAAMQPVVPAAMVGMRQLVLGALGATALFRVGMPACPARVTPRFVSGPIPDHQIARPCPIVAAITYGLDVSP